MVKDLLIALKELVGKLDILQESYRTILRNKSVARGLMARIVLKDLDPKPIQVCHEAPEEILKTLKEEPDLLSLQ